MNRVDAGALARTTVALAVLSVHLMAGGAGCAGCKDEPSGSVTPPRAPPRPRVIDRPGASVHPLPPHAIRADGVGPYTLGLPLATVLYELPTVPRLTVLDIPEVVRLTVIRAEEGQLVIGGEPMSETSFVSALAPGVARAEHDVAVGTSEGALDAAFGARFEAAHDRRIRRYQAAPAMRFLVEQGQVRAIVLWAGSTGAVAAAVGTGLDPCTASSAVPASPPVLEAGAQARAVCVGASREWLVWRDDEVALHTGAGDRGRRVGLFKLAGLRAVMPRVVDAQLEVWLVRFDGDASAWRWIVEQHRVEGGRAVKVAETVAYQITPTTASWLGATIEQVDLALDLDPTATGVAVGGLLLVRDPTNRARLRDVVPVLPREIPSRLSRPVSPIGRGREGVPVDAGGPSQVPDGPMTVDAAPPANR